MRWQISAPNNRQSGFTLVEMVAVIVLLGIMGVTIGNYVADGVRAYRSVAARDDMTQQGRFALERVSREVRNALPGSIRISGTATVQCLEFIPVSAGSTYIDLPVTAAAVSFRAANFSIQGAVTKVAAYTLSPDNVYGLSSPNYVKDASAVSAVDGNNERTITLAASTTFAEHSPTQRFYLFDQPVSFCVQANRLTRHSGYGFVDPQSTPPNAGELLAEFIQLNDGGAVTPFVFQPGSSQRGGIVHLDFRFLTSPQEQEWVRFSHEVFIRNTP